jgi:hypothetical protein
VASNDETSREADGLWYQWTPANAASVAYEDVAEAVARFESLDTDAGHEATRWLREDALRNHPSTVTYVLLSQSRIEGYIALASGSVTLTQRHRRELGPGERDYELSPTQGASLIAWLARHREADVSGRHIVLYALSIALKVARLQGTPVVVIDPFDDASANFWAEHYKFRRSRTHGGNDVRLWIPLYPKNRALPAE